MLQCVLLLTHASSTTACHTCCVENCTDSTSQNASTINWKSQCITVGSTRLLSTWSTVVHQSQTFPADVICGQHHLTIYRLSTFGCRAFSVAGPTVWNSLPDSLRDPVLSTNSFRQLLKSNLFRHYLSAHTAHDSALHKSITEIDIYIFLERLCEYC